MGQMRTKVTLCHLYLLEKRKRARKEFQRCLRLTWKYSSVSRMLLPQLWLPALLSGLFLPGSTPFHDTP